MRLFCVFLDDNDTLRALSDPHPTYTARYIVAETGGAKLLWCSPMIAGVGPLRLVKLFEASLAEKLRHASYTRIYLTLAWVAVLRPLFRAAIKDWLGAPDRAWRLFLFRMGPGKALKGSRVFLRKPRQR